MNGGREVWLDERMNGSVVWVWTDERTQACMNGKAREPGKQGGESPCREVDEKIMVHLLF